MNSSGVRHYIRTTPLSSWLALLGALVMLADGVALVFAPPELGARPAGFTFYVLWYLGVAVLLHPAAWYFKVMGLAMLQVATALALLGVSRYGLVTLFSAVAVLNTLTTIVAFAEIASKYRKLRRTHSLP